MRRRKNQTFQRYDLVRIADYYPWIYRGGKVISHRTGVGELAIICGSYADQFSWGTDKRSRMIYTVLFKDYGQISWYDEGYMTLVEHDRPDLYEKWNRRCR